MHSYPWKICFTCPDAGWAPYSYSGAVGNILGKVCGQVISAWPLPGHCFSHLEKHKLKRNDARIAFAVIAARKLLSYQIHQSFGEVK